MNDRKFSNFAPPTWSTPQTKGILLRLLYNSELELHRDLYSSMFIEDCSQLTPFKKQDKAVRQFRFNTNDEVISQALISAMADDEYFADQDDAIRSHIEEIFKSCLIYGRAIYYLHSVPDNYGRPKFKLVDYSHHKFLRLFGNWYQYVGPEIAGSDNGVFRYLGFSEVNPSRIYQIKLPNPERRILSRTLKKLQLISNYMHPSIEKISPPLTLEDPRAKSTNFDYDTFRKKIDLTLFSIIREIGWNARDYTNQNQSEFLSCQQMFRFKSFKIRVREFILSQLGQKLSRTISSVEREFHMEIFSDELAGLQDVERTSDNLLLGNISFSDVTDFVINE